MRGVDVERVTKKNKARYRVSFTFAIATRLSALLFFWLKKGGRLPLSPGAKVIYVRAEPCFRLSLQYSIYFVVYLLFLVAVPQTRGFSTPFSGLNDQGGGGMGDPRHGSRPAK